MKNAFSTFLRRPPLVSIFLALAAVAIWFIPGAADLLQFDRGAIARGEIWRLVTGHWTHFTSSHLVWDAMVFAVLGAVCEMRNRREFEVCLGFSVFAVSLIVYGFTGFETYRGLSGLDSALFVLAAGGMIAERLRGGDRRGAAAVGLFAAGFAAKTAVETLTGATLFMSATPLMVPVPAAHVAGALAGVGVLDATPRFGAGR